jgi:hypothetical protein
MRTVEPADRIDARNVYPGLCCISVAAACSFAVGDEARAPAGAANTPNINSAAATRSAT